MRPALDLVFSEARFEYDLYSLLKAFWPQAELTIRYAEEEAGRNNEHIANDLKEPTECGNVAIVRYDETETSARRVTFSLQIEEGTVCMLGIPSQKAEAAHAPGILPQEVESAITSGGPVREYSASCAVPDWNDTLEAKNRVKALVYRTLSELTGRKLPWGDLTGIRPVKLIGSLLDAGKSVDEAREIARQTWFVSREKADLALQIAQRERALLAELQPEDGVSLYIGIPFCPSICLYCSFGSHPLELWKDAVDPYLEALKKELSFLSDELQGKRLDTIYVGGGTPTTLSAQQLEELLREVTTQFSVDTVREFTVEAGRPDTITAEKLQVLRRFGVNRISVNPQTMNETTLQCIGRKHTAAETRNAFALAREAGFTNINMDLIVGLPGEGEEEVAQTLQEIRALSPDSLTVHSLALKRATRLHLFQEEYAAESFANSEAVMDKTAEAAAEMGMAPYYLYRQKQIAGNFENVGYARPGCEGLYNILIMEQRQSILAAGAGASTKFVAKDGSRTERVENVKDLNQYLTRVEEMIERKRPGMRAFL